MTFWYPLNTLTLSQSASQSVCFDYISFELVVNTQTIWLPMFCGRAYTLRVPNIPPPHDTVFDDVPNQKEQRVNFSRPLFSAEICCAVTSFSISLLFAFIDLILCLSDSFFVRFLFCSPNHKLHFI